MMRYVIVNGTTWEVIKGVRAFIQEGWVPQGGVTALPNGGYAQALIKIEENGESS